MKNKLLIVENDMDYRKYLVHFFTNREFSTTAVNNQRNALLLLKHEDFDAVIAEFCDNGIPADKLCREIQNRSDKTTLILMCKHQSPEAELKARRYAPVFFFVKPFSIEDLYAVVLRIFEIKCRKQGQLRHDPAK